MEPLFNRPVSYVRRTSRAQVEAELEKAGKEPAVNIFRAEAFTIEGWPDYSFTADGRKFGLFVDGRSIAHRRLKQFW